MSTLEWINLLCAIIISAPLACIVAQAIRRAAWSSGLTFCIVSLVCLAAGGAQTWVAGDLLGDYYVRRYNLDVRGCRYPGIISHETLPGGGTTDYAVAIYFEAVKNGRYTCFVREDTRLPMMYMPDCLKATMDLMEADFSRLKHHTDFNVGSMSFSAGELAAEIKKHIPHFVCEFKPDARQAIADSWPRSIDDSAARAEWGWKPSNDLAGMTTDMIRVLKERQAEGRLNY